MRIDSRRWYEGDALMADLTSHFREMLGDSEEEIGQRVRDRYPDAATILVREGTRPRAGFEGSTKRMPGGP